MDTVTTERPLETGWLPDTPVDDTLLRQFIFSQAEVNELTARAAGGRSTAPTRSSLPTAAPRSPTSTRRS